MLNICYFLFNINQYNLKAAFDYLLSNPLDPLDKAKFNEHCGVGIIVTPEQIKITVIIDLYNFIKELRFKS